MEALEYLRKLTAICNSFDGTFGKECFKCPIGGMCEQTPDEMSEEMQVKLVTIVEEFVLPEE